MNISDKILKLRIESGLTQEQLAEKINVSRQTISKWELGQSVPEIDKVILLSILFSVSTDYLIIDDERKKDKYRKNKLHLGSIYLISKDFFKSIEFYEKLLDMRVSSINNDRFAEFYIDNKCIAIMNEKYLYNHDYTGNGDYKFVLNFWVDDLITEEDRLRTLNIGEMSSILEAHPSYHYFHLKDPDNNVVEITGQLWRRK